MKTSAGLPQASVSKIVDRLRVLTADLYVLLTKTLNFHWNMEDPRFYFLHELLDGQYHQLLEEVDLVAERIRQLGKPVSASMQEFLKESTLKEVKNAKNGNEMLASLVESYEQLILLLRSDIELCDKLQDPATTDMLTQILRDYEKRAWILRSHL